MKLNPKQEAHLEYLREVNDRYHQARRTAQERAKKIVQEEISAHSAARDAAVYEAIQMGISKRKVGIEGLRTTSPNTVAEIYDRVRERVETVAVELVERPRLIFSWTPVATVGESAVKGSWLQFDGDMPHYVEGPIEGRGWLYYFAGGKWLRYPKQTDSLPEGAEEWVAENQPEEEK